MHRDLLVHPHIGSYSAMWVLAFAVAFAITRWRARRFGVEGRHVDNLVLLLMLVAPFGARFFSRLFYFPTELTVWEALQVWKGGGLVFYGGLIFGVGSAVLYCLIRRVPMLKMGDLATPGIAVGLAIGRVGCFLSGCCWGDLCVDHATLATVKDPVKQWQFQTAPTLSPPAFPLAVRFPADAGAWRQHVSAGLIPKTAPRSLPVHPTQLYEAALALALCVWLLRKKEGISGEIFWTFGVVYGVIRFAVEYLRADSSPDYFGFTVSQVISLAIGIVCLLFFMKGRYLVLQGMSSHPSPSTVPVRVK